MRMRYKLVNAIVGTALACFTDVTFANPECGAKLGPGDKRIALLGQPDEIYSFIIRGDLGVLNAARARSSATEEVPQSVELPVIEGVGFSIRVRDALELCSLAGLRQIWYLRPRVAGLYIRVVQSIEYPGHERIEGIDRQA
jgi:hypothetical protein